MRDLAQRVARFLLAPGSYSNTSHIQYLSHLLHEHCFRNPCLIHFPKKTDHIISISFQRSKSSEQEQAVSNAYWDQVWYCDPGS